jgi:hypothetical protein
MFDSVWLTHETLVSKILMVRELVNPKQVANAFVCSLATRRLDHRSALGSYAVLRHFLCHQSGTWGRCLICGRYSNSEPREEDLNVLNFERLKWGRVRHLQPLYAFFDLEQFLKLQIDEPQAEDIALLKELLRSIESAPQDITSAKLQTFLPKQVRSNKAERDVLVGILGLCGVLETRDHPGFLLRFVPKEDRELPSRRFVDMAYPACWWTGFDGVNWEAVNIWFGHLL